LAPKWPGLAPNLAKPGIWQLASAVLLLTLFASSVVRARTQSITTDEAFTTYLYFLKPLGQIFTSKFDANNHVLYTVLGWLSVHTFGMDELAIRLPALLAAALFFPAVFLLSSLLFGRSPLHLLATLLTAGNPYLLDFFTAGRGYGLALAFLALALSYTMARDKAGCFTRTSLLSIAVLAALSVTANLTFLFPISALFLTLALLEVHRYKASGQVLPKLLNICLYAALPFAALSGLILAAPLRTATPGDFYFGASNWQMTIGTAVHPSLIHNPADPGFIRWPLLFQMNQWIYTNSADYLAPALFCLTTIVGFITWLNPRRARKTDAIPCLVLAATIALVAIAHQALGLKLPVMRTTLSLLFLLALGLVSLIPQLNRGAWLLSPVYLFLFITDIRQWPSDFIADWSHDRSTRAFAEQIEKRRAASNLSSIRVGGSWVFEPSLNFYRIRNGYRAWEPLSRGEPGAPADYYMLAREDRHILESKHLTVLAEDPVSLTVLAKPEDH
jgi:hypothetical protein